PHVHFEIRDSQTENCLNPLLFGFPIADAVPPSISRLAMYDRNKSTYDQSPQMLALKKNGSNYTVGTGLVKVGSNKISFAVGAVDRFSGTPNTNGIYAARILMDDQPISGFELRNISYDDTRYINAQLDYPYKSTGFASLQHLSPLPGAQKVAYEFSNDDGCIHLGDGEVHRIMIEVKDANGNASRIRFNVQYDPALTRTFELRYTERFLPNNVNVFERDNFELFTTEKTIYDTVTVGLETSDNEVSNAISSKFQFLNHTIPCHDSVTVRLKPNKTIPPEFRDRIIIKNVSGSRSFVEKASWQKNFLSAKFRQFGSYQAFVDNEPPTVNAPATNLTKASRIVFTPRDNFEVIKYFRAEVDGQWLRFSNDKGRSWIYTFDEKFPRGEHELKLTVEDEAGNVMERTWKVNR
ncbi:MAG: M23 family peptidase, partial [Flavisolibacter sp.]